jgi:hypothetical protein
MQFNSARYGAGVTAYGQLQKQFVVVVMMIMTD